jgi:two-component system chemotaxis sensor kinase CheA
MGKQDEFLKRLLATFKVEAGEHLQVLASGLRELESRPEAARQTQLVETVFREAHSLKGAARAVDMAEIERLCQSLESVLAALKRQDIPLAPGLLQVLHQGVDCLADLLSYPEAEGTAADQVRLREIGQSLEEAATGVLPSADQEAVEHPLGPAPAVRTDEGKLGSAGTIRIPLARLDSLLRQAEELVSAKLAAGQQVRELQGTRAELGAWQEEWAKTRPKVRAIQQASPAPFLEYLELVHGHLSSLETRVGALAASAGREARSLGGRVDALLADVKKVLMLPFSSLLEGFPRLVRDLARDRGKEVELAIQGKELEIDRRILEEMKDPLVHLVRNSIDHGIEQPAARERQGKPARGMVSIALSPSNGDQVEILVSDDGAGIEAAQVQEAALRLGVISREEAAGLDVPGALELIFQSGVSTSPILTSVSGRGLGLAIVREKMERLGGILSIETRPGAGTSVRMVLPLTLATFRGVLVRVGEHLFVLPEIHAERVLRVQRDTVKTVENRETLVLDGQVLSLVRLAAVLELPRTSAAEDGLEGYAVVLAASGKRLAFLVDEVLEEQEVLVKSLGRPLSRVRNVAGATVLGTGKVVPILNVPDLVKSAVRASGVVAGPAMAPVEREEAQRRCVLVAEDSITARSLLKNILETAGYEVRTAVDGVDAFTQLRSGAFDLVVSDVDMPRMSGFDLTAKVRGDKKLADLPVVLVTALESREDRERGIDVGANAYVVKSSFDQSNLLDIIRRLV